MARRHDPELDDTTDTPPGSCPTCGKPSSKGEWDAVRGMHRACVPMGRPRGPETVQLTLTVLPASAERLKRLAGPLPRSQYLDLALEALDSPDPARGIEALARLVEKASEDTVRFPRGSVGALQAFEGRRRRKPRP